ncbi:MAG: TPM domain-containing protein [Desulfonatronovibrio sp.]
MIFSSSSSKRRQSSTMRILLMLILFVGVGYLFWNNFERSMDTVLIRHMVNDETDTLDQDAINEISTFSSNLQKKFGMGIEVRIFKNFAVPPSGDSRTIFIGLSPEQKEDIIVFPALLKRALPDEFVDYVVNDHFDQYWEDNNWQQGLMDFLNLLGQEIIKIERSE